MAGLLCETIVRLEGVCVHKGECVCVGAHSRLIVRLGMDACVRQRAFTFKKHAAVSQRGRRPTLFHVTKRDGGFSSRGSGSGLRQRPAEFSSKPSVFMAP